MSDAALSRANTHESALTELGEPLVPLTSSTRTVPLPCSPPPFTVYIIQVSPYFDPTYTRTGWIGQPPVLDRHEVVTDNGDVDTLRQATP